jgi:hypothetical protein
MNYEKEYECCISEQFEDTNKKIMKGRFLYDVVKEYAKELDMELIGIGRDLGLFEKGEELYKTWIYLAMTKHYQITKRIICVEKIGII